MENLKIYPYKLGSESAKMLAEALDAKRVKPDGRYVPKANHTVVNWGMGRNPNWLETAMYRGTNILNSPASVEIASNKLSALKHLDSAGIPVPGFTTSKEEVFHWLASGETVFARSELRGNSGEGITVITKEDFIANGPSAVVDAPLYTKFIEKDTEFRVHVFNGEIIDYCEKKKMAKERRPENFNKHICSNDMGWVFCRNNILHNDDVKNVAKAAVAAFDLNFGAVDVILKNGKPYILEVNTAPGMVGTTIEKYKAAIYNAMGLEAPASANNEAIATEETNLGRNVADELAVQANDDTVTITIPRDVAEALAAVLGTTR